MGQMATTKQYLYVRGTKEEIQQLKKKIPFPNSLSREGLSFSVSGKSP